jgi:type IV secretion system protein VirD4
MQLPQQDALVFIAGMPPIRAKKLRYYADRRFVGRRIPAPDLCLGAYADRPPARTDDWAGQARETDERLAGELTAEDFSADEGGIELHRHPSVEVPDPRPENTPQVETEEPDRDDHDVGADQRTMARVQAAVVRGHGLNQGQSRDLMPGM